MASLPGEEVAFKHGIPRSEHWIKVEKEYLMSHPLCEACKGDTPNKIVQVHHINPFHYVLLLGRPDLELDPRNLIALCETTKGNVEDNHHLLLGHLGNFREANLSVREDALTFFHGFKASSIKENLSYQKEVQTKRLKDFAMMTKEEKLSYRQKLDSDLPPNSQLCLKFNLIITPISELKL